MTAPSCGVACREIFQIVKVQAIVHKMVSTRRVKHITFCADEELIERARSRAARERKTLNIAFREWLQWYAGTEMGQQEYRELMRRLRHIRGGRSFSRNEMNER